MQEVEIQKRTICKTANLEDVMHNVILKFRHSLMEIKAVVDISDMDKTVYIDEKWLTFILCKIVQNSIKYFNKHENRLTIYSQNNGTHILLTIKDNGCGIRQSELTRLFQKGFTGSNRKKSNATGMGLYIYKKTV